MKAFVQKHSRRILRGFAWVLAAGFLVVGAGMAVTAYDVFVPAPRPPGYDNLVAAIERKDSSSVAKILDSGVDPNRYPDSKRALVQEIDITPLNVAVENRDLKVVKVLLEHGADPNMGDGWHQSPLDTAASNGDLAMMQLLVKGGSNVNDSSNECWALRSAVIQDKVASVRFLLARGAKWSAPNRYGTIFQIAHEHHASSAIVELLEDYAKQGTLTDHPSASVQ